MISELESCKSYYRREIGSLGPSKGPLTTTSFRSEIPILVRPRRKEPAPNRNWEAYILGQSGNSPNLSRLWCIPVRNGSVAQKSPVVRQSRVLLSESDCLGSEQTKDRIPELWGLISPHAVPVLGDSSIQAGDKCPQPGALLHLPPPP